MSELAWNNGHSIAEIASRDLDAALQLLADRAQYVTGASGAAIALRSGEHDRMLCRASSGSSAPQLGALLATDHGLSAEGVRTGQLQRCNNAQSDARVDHEACRRLGIASVLVMPIVSGDYVLGVFELFSGKAYAFNEPDISALQRLSAMVELAVKFAATEPSLVGVDAENTIEAYADAQAAQKLAPISQLPNDVVHRPEPRPPEIPVEKAEKIEAAPEPKKPLFWSAAAPTRGLEGAPEPAAPQTSVPPVLRNLRKCKACGFPISSGRTLCVECEEKQWRGGK